MLYESARARWNCPRCKKPVHSAEDGRGESVAMQLGSHKARIIKRFFGRTRGASVRLTFEDFGNKGHFCRLTTLAGRASRAKNGRGLNVLACRKRRVTKIYVYSRDNVCYFQVVIELICSTVHYNNDENCKEF